MSGVRHGLSAMTACCAGESASYSLTHSWAAASMGGSASGGGSEDGSSSRMAWRNARSHRGRWGVERCPSSTGRGL